jgi:hypothetical protein
MQTLFGSVAGNDFGRSGSSWSQQNTYTLVSEENLMLGEMVDISETYALFSIGKKNQAHYMTPLTSMWGGSTMPDFMEHINGLSLDPTTDKPYLFVGKSVYTGTYSWMKIKTLSSDTEILSYPQLMSIYNKNFIIGIPGFQNNEKPFKGGVYFGLSPN